MQVSYHIQDSHLPFPIPIRSIPFENNLVLHHLNSMLTTLQVHQSFYFRLKKNDFLPNEYITPDGEHIEATVRLFKKADKQKYPEIATEYF